MFSLEDGYYAPETIGPLNAHEGDTYSNFLITIELANVIDLSFSLWDPEHKCCICSKFKKLNSRVSDACHPQSLIAQ